MYDAMLAVLHSPILNINTRSKSVENYGLFLDNDSCGDYVVSSGNRSILFHKRVFDCLLVLQAFGRGG